MPAPSPLPALRSALRRWQLASSQALRVGADLGRYLAGRRYWIDAVAAGWLSIVGGRVLLTAAGLEASGLDVAWVPGAMPAPLRVRPVRPAPLQTRHQARAEESARVVAEMSPAGLLRTVPTRPGAYTLARAKRDVKAIYQGRALRSMRGAVRRWGLINLGEALREGAELSALLLGKRRYWFAGVAAGWLRLGAAVQGKRGPVFLTAEGLEMLRSGADVVAERAQEALQALRGPAFGVGA